ncbi:uncharacterized protein LOC113232102 [Hyposmocoma kahamanoa]|uniref:uncharacterized protein LOC113232102 n=1 Tax=Hyposmocoma kahamanoa TaxID=1477025 RepID=UPI000E6D8D94|nr:uncharacterized protein LOC113232102 [Hyposmocoma kahamanoa]
MLKDNPSLLPHIINFLMNSYGEHIGFDLMEESSAKDSQKQYVEIKDKNNTTCCPFAKKSKTLKMLMKRNNITGLSEDGFASVINDKLLVSTSKPIFSHTKYMEKIVDNVTAVNKSVMLMKIAHGKNTNDKP